MSFLFFFSILRRVIELYCLQFVILNSAYYEDNFGNTLPPYPAFIEGIRRAPDRSYTLTPAQTATALKNALRYIPLELHEQLAPEFMEELRTRGRIYGYRFRPAGDLKARRLMNIVANVWKAKPFKL